MNIKRNSIFFAVVFTALFFALNGSAAGQAAGQLLVNEVEFDPPSTTNEGCQYVEIRGANPGGIVPANTWFITIDNSNANPGTIAFAHNIGGTAVGANGTITILNTAAGTCPGRTYGAGTATVTVNLPLGLGFFSSRAFLLISRATPFAPGQNVDQNQDGQFDVPGTVIDGFAFNINPEEEFNYGNSPQIFAPTTGATDVPDAVTRFAGNTTPISVAAFYYGELAATPDETTEYAAPQSPNFPAGGALSPGAPNLPSTTAPGDAVADFNGDGRTDYAVTRTGGGEMGWFISINGSGATTILGWGLTGDVPVIEDYDNDNKDDIVVWRPGAPFAAAFYILRSSNNTVQITQFGQTGDDPAITGDWDGDGSADPAVYRDSAFGNQSGFYYRASSNNPTGGLTFIPFGLTGDLAVRGDFDGDARIDAAVYRPSNQVWYVRQSSNAQVTFTQFGLASDTRVSGDFDGDAKTDIAVFRGGTWIVLRSTNGQISYSQWGTGGDTPVTGDYNGDGSADLAIWRSGTFYISQSGGGVTFFPWGTSGDLPVASVFNN